MKSLEGLHPILGCGFFLTSGLKKAKISPWLSGSY